MLVNLVDFLITGYIALGTLCILLAIGQDTSSFVKDRLV